MSKPFIVAGEKGLKALPHWLKKLSINTSSFSDVRKIAVGYDTRPDSDWGGKYTRRGLVIVTNENFIYRTHAVIEKFMWGEVSELTAEAIAKHETPELRP